MKLAHREMRREGPRPHHQVIELRKLPDQLGLKRLQGILRLGPGPKPHSGAPLSMGKVPELREGELEGPDL